MRHPALHRRGLGDDLRGRPRRRRTARRRRCPADGGRRTHLRLGRQSGRRKVDDRVRRAAQATARVRAGRPFESGVGPPRTDPSRAGPVVSGRTVAALADWNLLAHRRVAAVDRRHAAGRPVDPTADEFDSRQRDGVQGARRGRRGSGVATVPGAAGLRGPVGPARGQSPPAPGRPGRTRRRPRRRRHRGARRAAGSPRRNHHGTSRIRAAAAPPRRRNRLGQRELAAAPRAHRATRGRFAGGAAAAAEVGQLAAAAPVVPRRSAGRRPRAVHGVDRRGGRRRRDRTAHRDNRRGPRRAAVPVPAAHRGAGALRRPRRAYPRPRRPRRSARL